VEAQCGVGEGHRYLSLLTERYFSSAKVFN